MAQAADSRQSILVVDDNEDNLRLMNVVLTKAGYACATAGNWKEALHKALELSPDLIYLDIVMPELSGYDVCRILKSYDSTKDIPVVFITAMSEGDAGDNVRNSGADYYITKPLDIKTFLSCTKNFIKKGSKFS